MENPSELLTPCRELKDSVIDGLEYRVTGLSLIADTEDSYPCPT